MPSDVQVFVRFDEQCVFAGEELSCVITFRNVVDLVETPTTPGPVRITNHSSRGALSTTVRLTHPPKPRPRHQPSLSLTSPPLSQGPIPPTKHRRSVSIVSVKSPLVSMPVTGDGHNDASQTRPTLLGHQRSSSLIQPLNETSRNSSPALPQVPELRLPTPRHARRNHPAATEPSAGSTRPSPSDFKFPRDRHDGGNQTLSPLPTPNHATSQDRVSPRAISQISTAASNRNSFDNASNNSGETFMSEQPSVMSEIPRLSNLVTHSLQRSGSLTVRRPQPAMLLMGYAQISATFTLDSSLVDQTPFEEVKKKGFLGGQAGGGVVGVKKKARPPNGLFGAFNFSSLGESLDSILGADNLSSVREMRAVANSRAIPLLSTPQSLLFVDLHLEPGEERSYSFAYRLPKGLPSSHRGRAIKIAYNLTIGVQGSPGKKEMQAVRQVSIPIRVFSGVDMDGEIFGHDLMQPYVILQDNVKTRQLQPSGEEIEAFERKKRATKTAKEFLKHLDTLLEVKPRRPTSVATIDMIFGGASDADGSATTRAINRAIMMSNQIANSNESSPNRFEIARSGRRIATVILDRPLHRLGETVTAVIELSAEQQVACTSLRTTLETSERVSGALAVRSAAAIGRITRKVYAVQSDNVLFCDRAVFNATIPVSGTPTFVTSGVSLDWLIKLEFGTIKEEANNDVTNAATQNRTSNNNNDDDESGDYNDRTMPTSRPVLIEELMTDERGTISVAVESLDCETFEVAIPIVVYGDVVTDYRESGSEVVGIPI